MSDKRLNDRAIKMMILCASRWRVFLPPVAAGQKRRQRTDCWGMRRSTGGRFWRPHWQRSEERIATHPVVLCLQDTTELATLHLVCSDVACDYDAITTTYKKRKYSAPLSAPPLAIPQHVADHAYP